MVLHSNYLLTIFRYTTGQRGLGIRMSRQTWTALFIIVVRGGAMGDRMTRAAVGGGVRMTLVVAGGWAFAKSAFPARL